MTLIDGRIAKWRALLADRLLRLSSPVRTVNRNAILVFGCQKSGTSAIASLMAEAGGLSSTVDIPALWRTPVRDVMEGKRRVEDLLDHHRAYFSRGLIKEPGLTLIMPEIVSAMGARKVVFVVRDPYDTVRSILQRRNVPGNLDGLTGDLERRLNKAHWHWTYDWPHRYRPTKPLCFENRHYVEGLAAMWQWSVEAFQKTVAAGHDVEVVRYEDFLGNKQGTIEAVLSVMGVDVKHDIAPFLDVNFQPKGDHSISVPDFFGGDNLARISAVTEAGRNYFNYSLTGS